MKCLLITGIYPPDIGGPATFIPKLAERIVAKGGDSHVITLDPGARIQETPLYKLTLIPRSAYIKRFIRCTITIYMGALRSDRIFSNGLYLESVLALRLLRRRSVAKIVGDPIWERQRNKKETTVAIRDFQKLELPWRYKLLRMVYKFSLNSYTVITCPSNELVEIVLGWGVKPPVVYIPNGVEVLEMPKSTKEFDLVYVGRLVPWKNIDSVIEITAAASLKTLIVGSGPLEQSLKELSVKLGANCTFKGELSQSGVSTSLHQSRAFVLLSEYEGLSFALLEAMASGLPAVVSNVKGNLDVITDQVDGLVLDLRDLHSRNQELIMLLRNESKLTIMGSHARTTVESRFNATNQLVKFLDLLK